MDSRVNRISYLLFESADLRAAEFERMSRSVFPSTIASESAVDRTEGATEGATDSLAIVIWAGTTVAGASGVLHLASAATQFSIRN